MSQESNTPGPSGPPQFRPVPGKPGVDLGENKHPAGWFQLLPKKTKTFLTDALKGPRNAPVRVFISGIEKYRISDISKHCL